MSERITLELPDTLAQAAREEAERTGQTVEAVLLRRLHQVYEEEFLRQYITPGETYEIGFSYIDGDGKAAAELLSFLNSQNDASGSNT